MDRPVTLRHLILGFGIAILTVTLLFWTANLSAEKLFSDGDESTLPCLNVSDPVKAVTAKPNTVCHQKLPESSVIEYRFNACGHRTELKCHRDQVASGRRVVLLGSSLVEGYGVPVEASFAHLLPAELERVGGVAVDVYDEAMQWGTPRSVALRMDDVLSEKPALVVWPLTPFDIQNAALRLPYLPGRQQGDQGEVRAGASTSAPPPALPGPAPFRERLLAAIDKHGGWGIFRAGFDRGIESMRQTKAVFGAQHLMYRDQHEFIKHFLGNRPEANYLLVPAPDDAQAQLETFERYYRDVSASLRTAGIPLYVMLLPSHPQVSLLAGAAGDFPDADPRALDRKLQALVLRHGDHYVGILDGFTQVQDPSANFYAVDEHANERGHRLFAEVIAQRLAATPSFMDSLAPSVAVAGPERR